MKIVIFAFLVISSSSAFSYTVCSNGDTLYSENLKSFGIPQIPVGTPLGSKSLIFREQTIASQQFYVEDPDNWINFRDWDYQLELLNPKTVWTNPANMLESVFTASLTFKDKDGTVLVENQNVTCHQDETAAP